MTRRQLIKLQSSKQNLSLRLVLLFSEAPNGWRYPLVGGTRRCHFDGTHFKPRKLPENAPTPTSRVHAVLGAVELEDSLAKKDITANPTKF